MASVKIRNHVSPRDNFGRFIKDIEGAATQVVSDALDAGIQASRAAAPERTSRLKNSFSKHIVSRTVGYYQNDAYYAEYQDQGTSPHHMVGNPYFKFYWEREGRDWIPGLFGTPDVIWHPGNPATHFMIAGYGPMVAKAKAVMPRYYPG